MPAPTHAGAEDDVKITALKLPLGTLSAEMDAYFKKCDEKLGFVPNVLKAFAFDDGKLKAFVDYRQQLVQDTANLSKLEIEMMRRWYRRRTAASTASPRTATPCASSAIPCSGK